MAGLLVILYNYIHRLILFCHVTLLWYYFITKPRKDNNEVQQGLIPVLMTMQYLEILVQFPLPGKLYWFEAYETCPSLFCRPHIHVANQKQMVIHKSVLKLPNWYYKLILCIYLSIGYLYIYLNKEIVYY